jgi:hypothetical protein
VISSVLAVSIRGSRETDLELRRHYLVTDYRRWKVTEE